ncbi:MAG TPA: hypothetical protein VE524_06740 [Nitrososphaeraceae archaeon]|nr:hypothetical protein [Nitrososphaeraceae archaeon]
MDLDTFLRFILPSAVFTKVLFPSLSISIHVGVTCGEPSFIGVSVDK